MPQRGIHRADRILWSAPLWGALMALSLYVGLQLRVGGLTSHMAALLALHFAGGTLAYPIAVMGLRVVAGNKRAEARFSAAFLCLGGMTIGLTAVLFAIIYRSFYAQWHGEFATWLWVYQLAFTLASALYQFAVIGVRNFLPLGLVFLVAASLWLVKTTR
ncbi:MAG: hypothetical protein GY789_01825 [Hyphomicrobiales bacterium]|nr:hypothetical protein [Hyphomicrobiales bacterium]MCP5000297.1 hypothetical protein [Hyphomicrobiales bacterium]